MRYVILALLITGCVASRPLPQPSANNEVGFVIKGVRVHFSGDKAQGYNALVQEIRLDNGDSLVEAFKLDTDWIWDSHTWSSTEEVRHMTIYLAQVEGADWSPIGFAHLPENHDGTLRTTVGRGFNSRHQRRYATQGTITKRSPHQMVWQIDSDGEEMRVWVGR